MSNLAVIQEDISSKLNDAGVTSLLPDGTSVASFIRASAVAIASNKDMLEVDQDSLVMALIKCATDGLIPDNREAAILVFNTKIKGANGQQDKWVKKAQYLPMIEGVMKRARMSGQILTMSAKAVYENDTFEYWIDENGEHLNYRPNFDERGSFKLAFAYAKLTTGEILVEAMTKEDVDKVRSASKTGNYGPWSDWYDRMACKSTFHRLAKRLPNASEIVQLCELGMNMTFDNATDKEIIPNVTNAHKKLAGLLDGKDPAKYLPWLRVKNLSDLDDASASAAVLKLESAKQ